jgi:hypothetical protein
MCHVYWHVYYHMTTSVTYLAKAFSSAISNLLIFSYVSRVLACVLPRDYRYDVPGQSLLLSYLQALHVLPHHLQFLVDLFSLGSWQINFIKFLAQHYAARIWITKRSWHKGLINSTDFFFKGFKLKIWTLSSIGIKMFLLNISEVEFLHSGKYCMSQQFQKVIVKMRLC